MFCKYAGEQTVGTHGHRGGVPYEAEVYRRILQHAGVSTPLFHGMCRDDATGWVWLVIEHLEDARSSSNVHGAMGDVACWIGRFHALFDEDRLGSEQSFLTTYDGAYYMGWVRRARRFADLGQEPVPWLASLGAWFEEHLQRLLASTTLIHGEFYPHNVLIRHGVVYPVDWESAAIAAGEIDIAALTDGWPVDITAQCVQLYQGARWPTGSPPDFHNTLEIARLYLHFRWLGHRSSARNLDRWLWRVDQLRQTGERLGLI